MRVLSELAAHSDLSERAAHSDLSESAADMSGLSELAARSALSESAADMSGLSELAAHSDLSELAAHSDLFEPAMDMPGLSELAAHSDLSESATNKLYSGRLSVDTPRTGQARSTRPLSHFHDIGRSSDPGTRPAVGPAVSGPSRSSEPPLQSTRPGSGTLRPRATAPVSSGLGAALPCR